MEDPNKKCPLFLLGRGKYEGNNEYIKEFDEFLNTKQREYMDKHVVRSLKFFKTCLREWTGGGSEPLQVLNNYLRLKRRQDYINALIYFGSDLIIDDFIHEFNNFILNAPRFSKDVKLYRGTMNIEPYKIDSSRQQFIVTGISGYTFFKEWLDYGFDDLKKDENKQQCCIYELTLPANSPFLFLGNISKNSIENEFMLPISSIFDFTGQRIEDNVVIISGIFVGYDSFPSIQLSFDEKIIAMNLSKEVYLHRNGNNDVTLKLLMDNYSNAFLDNEDAEILIRNILSRNPYFNWFYEFVRSRQSQKLTFKVKTKKLKSYKKVKKN